MVALHSDPVAAAVARPRSRHFFELDGLRGLAVLAVVGYHFGIPGMLGGYLGVDVFLVLSGFVVIRSLSRSTLEPGWVRQFFLRRLARLAPAMVPLLVFATLWYGIQTPGYTVHEIVAVASGALMAYNVGHVFAHADPALAHLWSLAVEWHFYLAAPLLVAPRRRTHAHPAGWLVATAVLVVLVRSAALAIGAIGPQTAFTLTPFRLDGLLLGAALALASPEWLAATCRRRGRLIGASAATVLLVLVAAGPVWYARPKISLIITMPLATTATAVLVALAAADTLGPLMRRCLSSKPLVWLGERSYSIYLWHYVAGTVVIAGGSERFQGVWTTAAMLGTSLAAAVLSYDFVERPLRSVITARIRHVP